MLKHSSATQNGAAVLFTFNRTVHQDSYVSINCTNNSYPNSATGTNVTYNVSATNHGQGEVQHVAYVPTEAKLRIEELSLEYKEALLRCADPKFYKVLSIAESPSSKERPTRQLVQSKRASID